MVEAAATARADGRRMTAQRRLILQTLNELGGHPTADEICAAARRHDGSLHPSTVYRTLAWLENAGLVEHCHLDAGPDDKRSERFDPATSSEHHHFVCTACGRVIEFESPRVDDVKRDFAHQHGAAVERAALTLYGLCPDCRGLAQNAGRSADRSDHAKA
jgi:Fe2+ or Zn2+ uptake regulation protein